MSESISVVVDNLGYVFGNFTIDGGKRSRDDSNEDGPKRQRLSEEVRKTHTDKFKTIFKHLNTFSFTKKLKHDHRAESKGSHKAARRK